LIASPLPGPEIARLSWGWSIENLERLTLTTTTREERDYSFFYPEGKKMVHLLN